MNNRGVNTAILVLLIFSVSFIVVNAQTNVVNLKDWVKVEIVSPVESNGAIPINIQDQHSPALDLYFVNNYKVDTTMQENSLINTYTINLTTGHNISVGDQVELIDNTTIRGYIGLAVTVDTNIVTLDTPLNTNFSYLTTAVKIFTRDLNVDGSVNPVTFSISPPLPVEIDITRVMFQMITTTSPDFAKFGDVPVLTNGVVMRVVNGRVTNLFNVKSNAQLVNLMYDVRFFDASNPGQGVYGLGGRMTYGGQNKHGVTIRLAEPDETLEIIIQDDLTDLEEFHMLAAGHVVTD